MNLWLVGLAHNIDNNDWTLTGAFSTRELALRACHGKSEAFIFQMKMDVDYTDITDFEIEMPFLEVVN